MNGSSQPLSFATKPRFPMGMWYFNSKATFQKVSPTEYLLFTGIHEEIIVKKLDEYGISYKLTPYSFSDLKARFEGTKIVFENVQHAAMFIFYLGNEVDFIDVNSLV